MIQINDKKDCCGCGACVQRCPKHCIMMVEDEEGFLYPQVDERLCIDCHLCEKVCPVLNCDSAREPLACYAAVNPDEAVRRASSSGGVFTLLAEQVIAEGGVVFGARFDENWEVVHGYAETVDGLADFRGSKYVQSRMGDSYSRAEAFLKQGRLVLFSGTPCQIAGLRRYLRKEYDNLLTVDFICHGVPSPGVWRKYLSEEVARQCDRKNTVLSHPIRVEDARIEGISFRDKTLGWKKFSFALTLSVADSHGAKIQFCSRSHLKENLFLKGFLADLYLRPSCHECPTKEGKSQSDITIADFWGINNLMPQLDDDRGVSVVMVNTASGEQLLGKLKVSKYSTEYQVIARLNPALVKSAPETTRRKRFFFNDGKSFEAKIKKLTKQPIRRRVRYAISIVLHKIFGKTIILSFKKIFHR